MSPVTQKRFIPTGAILMLLGHALNLPEQRGEFTAIVDIVDCKTCTGMTNSVP